MHMYHYVRDGSKKKKITLQACLLVHPQFLAGFNFPKNTHTLTKSIKDNHCFLSFIDTYIYIIRKKFIDIYICLI